MWFAFAVHEWAHNSELVTDVYHHVLNCDDDDDIIMMIMLMLIIIIIIVIFFTFVVCKIREKFSTYSNHSSKL
jgi:uncharacterized membrane protein